MNSDRDNKILAAAAQVREAVEMSWQASENGSWTPPIAFEEDFSQEARIAAKENGLANEDGTVGNDVIDEILRAYKQKGQERIDSILASYNK